MGTRYPRRIALFTGSRGVGSGRGASKETPATKLFGHIVVATEGNRDRVEFVCNAPLCTAMV